MATERTSDRFGFGRGRVVAIKYSDTGELLIRAGAVEEVEHKSQDKQTRISCENALIIINDDEVAEYEISQHNRILIRCKNYTVEIRGNDAPIEIGRFAELLDSRIGTKRKRQQDTARRGETKDSLGYYELLGISTCCTKDEIKKAYKKRCLEVHPDVNKSEDAHEEFLKVQIAYEVLSDAKKRADYDARNVRVPNRERKSSESKQETDSTFEPIRCSRCNCVTAQPRYVVFWETFSFLSTIRSPVQGVMCTKCAGDAAYAATVKSLIFGWWGIWGLIFTPTSVLTNLSGGQKPSENNGRILLHQSWYFAQNRKPELAYILAVEAAAYLRRSSAKEKESLLSICESIIDEYKVFGEGKSLEDAWAKRLPKTTEQWKAVALCGAAWIAGISLLSSAIEHAEKTNKEGAPKYTYQQPQPTKITPPADTDGLKGTQTKIEMPIPPTYLPLNTGYLPSKQIRDNGGNSEVTLIDNSGSNFHIKLYRRAQGEWAISRELYLKANERFTMRDLEPGEYEIRRMNVQSKNASKTRTFNLEETRTYDGINYTTYTITLNAAQGNSKITPISSKDF